MGLQMFMFEIHVYRTHQYDAVFWEIIEFIYLLLIYQIHSWLKTFNDYLLQLYFAENVFLFSILCR